MNEEERIELQLDASQWACQEADKLIKKWKSCKTAHARSKLIPKMEEMRRRLSFEKRAIDILAGPFLEGEEWKTE